MSDERSREKPPGEREGEVPPVPVERTAPDSRSGQATFSEAQVAKILRRVAELERGRADKKPELTLAEVEAIAREAGLDPSLVQLAAQSLREQAAPSSLGTRLLGAPLSRTFERVIDGELTLREHESMGEELRRVFRELPMQGRAPRIASVGRTLTASATTGAGRIELELIPRAGRTLLRIYVNCGGLAGALFGGMGGGVGLSMTPVAIPISQALSPAHPWPVGLALAAGWLGSVALSIRTLFSWRARTRYREMEQLADRLAAKLRDELSAK